MKPAENLNEKKCDKLKIIHLLKRYINISCSNNGVQTNVSTDNRFADRDG